ncbi:MAG: GNAT family N-acetyltransferase [Pyrinomonadaceae bacterium]
MDSNITMETERLFHRRFTDDDLERLVEMRSTMDTARYLGGEIAMTRDWISDRLKYYMSVYPTGIGMNAMFWKETNEMIGWSGIQPLGKTGEIEVGYGMIKEYWQRGIGYETAKGWLDFGFREKGLERIVAVAHPDNTGSWRIMEKLGMKFEKRDFHYDMEVVFYGISRDEFLNAPGGQA